MHFMQNALKSACFILDEVFCCHSWGNNVMSGELFHAMACVDNRQSTTSCMQDCDNLGLEHTQQEQQKEGTSHQEGRKCMLAQVKTVSPVFSLVALTQKRPCSTRSWSDCDQSNCRA